MEQQSVHKTYKYRLDPTPEQAKALGVTLWRCRTVYNVALEQRKRWWERGQGIGASYYQQKAELPDLKAACPEYSEIHAHALQDVILRLDRAFQAFFRRVTAGETPGYPRFQGTLQELRLSCGRHWRGRSWARAPSLQGWAHPHSAPSSAGRDTQDRHAPPGSGRVVGVLLLCGCAGANLATAWTGGWPRSGDRGVRHLI